MTGFERGDVLLARFPDSNLTTFKLRRPGARRAERGSVMTVSTRLYAFGCARS
jgi:hypothetical protein